CPGANCTLRQAILTAASGDTINFALPAKSTITLTTDELHIDRNVNIVGPGANLLTIRRSAEAGTPQFRIFELHSSDMVGLTVNFYGVTIANGDAPGFGEGGGVYSNGGTVSITNCAISGNTTNSASATGA